MDENKNEVKTYKAIFTVFVDAKDINEARIKALEIISLGPPSFTGDDIYEYFT